MENDGNIVTVPKSDGDSTTEEKALPKPLCDDDLDDLLDSALEDFEKKPVALPDGTKENVQRKNDQEGAACHTGSSTEIPDEQEAMFNELFTAAGSDDGEAALEDMMKKLMSGQPEMMQQLESMAQNLDTIVPPDDSTASVDSTLQQTLENLAQNVQHLQYPKWLEDNSSKVSEKDLENYTKQFELMKTIVHEYESEGTGDSEDVKKKRFEKILDTMQKMQELGQPPKDLIGDMPPGIDLDENGLPKLPGSTDQCSIM
ncbi:hypothetical protein LSH36_4g02038 [Paralvinella palmiformis]|uniref:Peroxin-19 n=1 Tax=Paralvinella palmiformis TaxID=53620 RepID=A0AAD9KF65_9ANNE|nr:hypothetical protein LSH36_4g02038 [Paralvinella palmiformis]